MEAGTAGIAEEVSQALRLGDEDIGATMALLMDELAHGVLIVDPTGRLLHANQAARHELARRRVVVGSLGLGQALGAQDARQLQDALAKVAAGKRSLVTVRPGEGAPLSLAVLPLGTGRAGPSAALVFSRPAVCESLMLCFFARSHGLTSTEEHVLGILCQGYSAPQVAEQMDVAVSTVRSHVRSLCAKTRSSGVRELVNRVAVLPPVAPTPWKQPLH